MANLKAMLLAQKNEDTNNQPKAASVAQPLSSSRLSREGTITEKPKVSFTSARQAHVGSKDSSSLSTFTSSSSSGLNGATITDKSSVNAISNSDSRRRSRDRTSHRERESKRERKHYPSYRSATGEDSPGPDRGKKRWRKSDAVYTSEDVYIEPANRHHARSGEILRSVAVFPPYRNKRK